MKKLKTFFQSLILFPVFAFAQDNISDSLETSVMTEVHITIDPSKGIASCGQMAFGACHIPSVPHCPVILPQLIDAGFNNVRTSMWIETILPEDITYEDYINNVNDVQNPDNWNFTNMEHAVMAKEAGMKVMMIIAYCPPWLSWNGKVNGIPKDFEVYKDIVRKIYERYYTHIDWIEVYNEPGYFMTIEESPYETVGAALADIYMACVEVVREITPDMPMGGTSVVVWSDGGVGGKTNQDFFADERINKDNFNFYSHHIYSDYEMPTTEERVKRVRDELANFGYKYTPIYFTEWSSSINNIADTITYTGTRSHTFVGKCLVNWMREGLEGAQHWNYLQAYTVEGETEEGIAEDAHGMYVWNPTTKQGWLVPKAFVFKLMSKTLGLGEGTGGNTVIETSGEAANELLDIASFVNRKFERSTVIVNDNPFPVRVEIDYMYAHFSQIECYTVTYTDRGEVGENVLFKEQSDRTECRVVVPPLSVVGIKYIQ